jgi:hypothetical protein
VPDESSRHVNKLSFGGKRVQRVGEEQGEQRQFTSSKGPERMENLPPWTRDRLPSKGIFFPYFSYLIRTHLLIIVCVCKIKKGLSVQVKNKPRDGT